MKVILVGSLEDRTTLGQQLAGREIEIVGEFPTLASARAAALRADALVLAMVGRGDATIDEPLTPREIEVLELLAEGLSNKRIAARLGISDQTVKFHVASISGKLGAVNRTDVVRRAIRRGLVSV